MDMKRRHRPVPQQRRQGRQGGLVRPRRMDQAEWGRVAGKDVTIAMLDAPGNPGYPTYWHARGYGLFAANPLGQAALSNNKDTLNFAIAEGSPATFRYRILLIDGNPSAADMQKYAAQWASTVGGLPQRRTHRGRRIGYRVPGTGYPPPGTRLLGSQVRRPARHGVACSPSPAADMRARGHDDDDECTDRRRCVCSVGDDDRSDEFARAGAGQKEGNREGVCRTGADGRGGRVGRRDLQDQMRRLSHARRQLADRADELRRRRLEARVVGEGTDPPPSPMASPARR